MVRLRVAGLAVLALLIAGPAHALVVDPITGGSGNFFWTDGVGEFVSSAMEDTGTYQSLEYLDRAGKVNKDRLLVLRTASNYTMPPPGKTAQWSRNHPYPDGGRPALESAFVVGNVVVQALLEGWDEYATTIPGGRTE